MPGRPITKIAWDDLPGRWLSISTSSGGCLGLVKETIPGKTFRQLIACPYVLKNATETRVCRSDRIINIVELVDNKNASYVVYDTVDDMRDDVMLALLKHDGIGRPSVALILELEEYRERFGITEWISRSNKGPKRLEPGLNV